MWILSYYVCVYPLSHYVSNYFICGLNCRIPCHFKETPKIGGFRLSHYVSMYPLSHCVCAYPCIHQVNIFKMIVTAYLRIHFDIHLRQRKEYTVCLFVVLNTTEGRKAHKRDNCVSTYPALSGIQLWSGRVFCSYSHVCLMAKNKTSYSFLTSSNLKNSLENSKML